MPGTVKRRSYDSSRRREQAQRARARTLDAARRAFLDRGYAATTVAGIAADADVSVETVYKAFGNKPGLLKAVFDVAVAGDDAPVAIMDRSWVAAITAESDPRVKLRMYAAQLAELMPRTAPVQLVVRAAATVDTDIERVWRQMQDERLAGMAAFAGHLHAAGHLREDLTADDARDVLWTYNSVELYELLVLERGWNARRYEDFLAAALASALLPDSARSRRRGRS
jgi:AcrR family transcriptional regulator